MNPFVWLLDRWRVFADWLLQLGLTVGAIYLVLWIDKKELYWLMTVFACLFFVRLLLLELEQFIWKKKLEKVKK